MPSHNFPFEMSEENEHEDFRLLVLFFVTQKQNMRLEHIQNYKRILLEKAKREEDCKCRRMLFATADFVSKLSDAWDEVYKREYLSEARPFLPPGLELLRNIRFYLTDQGVIVQLPQPHQGNLMLGLDPNVMLLCLHTNPDGTLQAPLMLSSFN